MALEIGSNIVWHTNTQLHGHTFILLGGPPAGCLLLAYAALSRGRLAIGARYHLMNLAGAAGLAINGAVHRAWPSTALNLIWLGIGLSALRHAKTNARTPTPHAAQTPDQ